MTGGYIDRGLEPYEHMVIVITLKGPIPAEVTKQWDDQLEIIKNAFGDKMIAVTIEGMMTPKGRGGRPLDPAPGGRPLQARRPRRGRR